MTEPTIADFQKAFRCLERNRCTKAPNEVWTTEEFAKEMVEELGGEWAPDGTGTQRIGNLIIHVPYQVYEGAKK